MTTQRHGAFEVLDAFAVRAHYEKLPSEIIAYFFDKKEAVGYSEQCPGIDAGTVEVCKVEVVWRYGEAVVLGPSIRGSASLRHSLVPQSGISTTNKVA